MSSGSAHENTSTDLLWGMLDLWTVAVFVVLTGVSVFTLDPSALPTVTLLLVLLFVFLLPGYAVIAALQPRSPRERRFEEGDQYGPAIGPGGGMSVTERLVLAAGVSVGVATATGFALHATGVGIQPEPATVVLAVVTLTGCAVAAVRRSRLDPKSRFDGSDVVGSLAPVRGLFVRWSTVDLVITSLIVVSVVVAVGGATFVAVSVDGGEPYTELSVLSANETGDPVAAEYPSDEDGAGTLLVEVANRERQAMNYTLVVEHQRVDGGAVAQSEERDRVSVDLPPDGEWSREYQVPTGDDPARERLVFLLYADSPPNDPSRESAYRAVHVWIGEPTDVE